MTDQTTAPSERKKQLDARRKLIADRMPKVERVRVTPATDDIRRVLTHPSNGTKFPESGSVEWPLDNFTKRRLRDGSVVREQAQPQPAREQPRKPAPARSE